MKFESLCPRLYCVNICWWCSKNLRWWRNSEKHSQSTHQICTRSSAVHISGTVLSYCVLCKCGVNYAWLCSILKLVTCVSACRPDGASLLLLLNLKATFITWGSLVHLKPDNQKQKTLQRSLRLNCSICFFIVRLLNHKLSGHLIHLKMWNMCWRNYHNIKYNNYFNMIKWNTRKC